MNQELRVAVVGAGPSGFYACEELLKAADFDVSIDLFERLPTPFGLVRYGVAPDHQKIKNVTAVFEKVLADPRVRFVGNTTVGEAELQWMRKAYHAILFTVGAQTDRRLGIPGEDTPGSYPATDFVAWYNGHPDFAQHQFLLDQPRVAVVGVGNVAIDVARILLAGVDRLATTDIADHALEALRESKVEEVVLLARRGPAQAAFTNPELRELLEMEDVSLEIDPVDLEIDVHTRSALQAEPDKMVQKRLELLAQAQPRAGARKRLLLRFLASPLEIHGESRVQRLSIVKNRLNEQLQAEPTGELSELAVGAVFRSIGYMGKPLADLPFDSRRGVWPNQGGRLVDLAGTPLPGLYVAGWIKRGPSGVIGTNKPCAKETVAALLDDARNQRLVEPSSVLVLPNDHVDFAAWKRLDDHELNLGKNLGRPRVKLVERELMLNHSREVVAKEVGAR